MLMLLLPGFKVDESVVLIDDTETLASALVFATNGGKSDSHEVVAQSRQGLYDKLLAGWKGGDTASQLIINDKVVAGIGINANFLDGAEATRAGRASGPGPF